MTTQLPLIGNEVITTTIENIPLGSLPVIPADIDDAFVRSIATGLINPITVRRGGDTFEVIAGRRRLAAARKLGWETIAATISSAVNGDLLVLQENIQRKRSR